MIKGDTYLCAQFLSSLVEEKMKSHSILMSSAVHELLHVDTCMFMTKLRGMCLQQTTHSDSFFLRILPMTFKDNAVSKWMHGAHVSHGNSNI
jgi:hypothetical protein